MPALKNQSVNPEDRKMPNVKELLHFIPHGRTHAIRREALCMISGLTDRELRSAVAELRRSGVPILSSTNCAGYFLPSPVDGANEARTFINNQRSRAKSCFISIRAARRYCREAGQIKMEDGESGRGCV